MRPSKKDMRIVEALRKRAITDLRTVSCNALPVAYRAVPEQATQRIGCGTCSRTHGTYHSWGRSIEGLSFLAADDPAQMIGAFSEHQFWVTPHNENERYASGTYPTSSGANEPGRVDPRQSVHCQHRHRRLVHLGVPSHHAGRGLAGDADNVPPVPDPPVPLL